MKQWLDSDAGKNLSFGVISFYSEQVNCIKDELVKCGVAEIPKKDNNFEIVSKYKFIEQSKSSDKGSEERIKIGSVDSFQGMEFDVVFLSVVRTNRSNNIKKGKITEKIKRSTFGHLVSKNRLCVSMSSH